MNDRKLAKRIPKTMRFVAEHGCSLERTKNNHYVVVCPDGYKVHLPGSPSDHRSDKNALSLLRRHIKQAVGK